MRTDVSAYLLAVLRTERGAWPRVIAEHAWGLQISDPDAVPEYLISVMDTNPQNSRAFEVASDIWMLMTHCSNGHEFTPENTYIRADKRHCRTCKRNARLPKAAQSSGSVA